MSTPSGVPRSRAMLRLPRLECSINGWTSPVIGITPEDARPRMASPRSVGSTLMISAPQSASSAVAAGTKVCSATSRTRTPFMTGVALTRSLPPNLTSTSTLPRRRGTWFGRHLHHHLADGLPFGHPAQRVARVGEVERRADEGHGLAGHQEVHQLAVVAGHFLGPVTGEVAELEAEDRTSLEEHQIQRYAGDGSRREAHRDEAAPEVERAQRGLGQVATDRVDHDVGPAGQRPSEGLAEVAGAMVDEAGGPQGAGRLEVLRRR